MNQEEYKIKSQRSHRIFVLECKKQNRIMEEEEPASVKALRRGTRGGEGGRRDSLTGWGEQALLHTRDQAPFSVVDGSLSGFWRWALLWSLPKSRFCSLE